MRDCRGTPRKTAAVYCVWVIGPGRSSRHTVMPGLVPGIHAYDRIARKTWMAGTSPAMTISRLSARPRLLAPMQDRDRLDRADLRRRATECHPTELARRTRA